MLRLQLVQEIIFVQILQRRFCFSKRDVKIQYWIKAQAFFALDSSELICSGTREFMVHVIEEPDAL